MRDEHSGGNGLFKSRSNVVLIAFALIAGYFLIAEHRAHVIEYLPFILLLACPLLHMFHGHGGHGSHGGDATSGESTDTQNSKRPSDSASGSKDAGSEQHRHH